MSDVKKYDGAKEFVLETTHGCYSDYGWSFTGAFDDIEDAKRQCDHWNKTSGDYRIVSSGKVVYPKLNKPE